MKRFAPWTDAQVRALNRWQKDGRFHEFTCAQEHLGERTLVANNAGWRCPTCGYTQDWAHDFMCQEQSV